MLQEIRLARVASYDVAGVTLSALKPINFIFGTNGTGKTTISRVIADLATYPTCALTWDKGQSVETLVYNRDFVQRNFTAQLRGIFTLGEAERDTLAKIEEAKAKVKDVTDDINQQRGTLGLTDDAGKRGERKVLRAQFEAECWKIKGRHDPHFKDAFAGLRNSQARFCDRVLQEFQSNTAALEELDALKARATSLFGQEPERLTAIPPIDARDLLAAEAEPVLAKKVMGKDDVDVAALIKRLGSSDWVRQGLPYLEQGEQCPFCQQNVEADLATRLNAYFDETFLADMADITRVLEAYEVHAGDILARLEEIRASASHLDSAAFQADIDRLAARLEVNKRLLVNKRKEPSAQITLQPIGDITAALSGQIEAANTAIDQHNALVDNLAAERTRLTREIWRCLLNENDAALQAFASNDADLEKAIKGLSGGIAAKEAQLAAHKAELRTLEKSITSVQPTVDEINRLLASFGFTGFKLKTAGEHDHLYEILRDDGGNAADTLSEGERSFVSFLYFYHLLRGSMSETGMSAERIVVFDDPVSSLDSDVLFIVSTLIKRVLKEAREQTGQIKQAFVLTHNIYFHKEVSFDPNRGAEARNYETFWIVRKLGGVSQVTGYPANPIKTSYELLWEEVRNPGRSKLTIQNTLRRIIENYFKILGSVDTTEIVGKFSGKDQQVCASLFSWLHDGSHNAHDDLYVSADDGLVDRYLAVFKRIFDETKHDAHYRMMMKIGDVDDAPAAVAPLLANAATNG